MIRRYKPLEPSSGTTIPHSMRRAVLERDGGCVGPKVGMSGVCFGANELDHVRASGAIGKKSETSTRNLVTLCSTHHRAKTLHGRQWRPVLLRWIELSGNSHSECVDLCSIDCIARVAPQ